MFIVGVTGGIGSGKSSVCRIFQELNCPLIDADVVAREVVEPGRPAWHKIRQAFGLDVFFSDGSLDRERLGQLIFADTAKRKLLNSITHPYIYRSIVYKLFIYLIKGERFVVLDLPLLFEAGTMLPFVNTTIVVYCNRDMQVQRLHARNGYSTEAALERINSQMPLDEKCRRADIIINNQGSTDSLRDEVLTIHDKLNRSKAHWKLRFVLLSVVFFTAFIVYKIF